MKLLITGGCGFLGSNLALYAMSNGVELSVFDNLSRLGSSKNLRWLNENGKFDFIYGDIRNRNDVENLIKKEFDAVFHLAGQVAMTTSISDPMKDFETNAFGSFNLLDSIKKYSPDTAVLYSSTNKVYGDLEQYSYQEKGLRYTCDEFPEGFDESVPLEFHSPYGCSKGAADQYMLDFHRIFKLKAVVFRHSSMYGSRQFSTYDQGWVGWFCQKALEQKNNSSAHPFTISGNGKQVRDILYSDDMVRLYFDALKNIDTIQGNAFNIGGTMSQSLSLLELLNMLEDITGTKLRYEQIPPRESDQKVFVANTSKIKAMIGWVPQTTSFEGISNMLSSLELQIT